MPNYTVRVTYTYPVQATNARDALSTVPIVVKVKLPTAEGITEIAKDGMVVLRAKLVRGKEAIAEEIE